jgi:AcrR family transcriptional regulator
MIDEIKAIARRHLASDGANLSLRAVARDLGMVSSAVYRYFPSRDDLLTALIIDAYDALGAVAEKADASCPRDDLRGRWLAIAGNIRSWALRNPHEYALIYGSPVPGYAAPADTVPPATRTTAVLAALLRAAAAAGRDADPLDSPLPAAVGEDFRRIGSDPRFGGVPDAALARGLALWTELFGMLSFELFGQFNNVIENRDAFFDFQMRAAAAVAGLV